MKSSRLLLLLLLLSAVAVADTMNDPRVIVGNGTGTTFLSQPVFNFSLSDPAVCTETQTSPLAIWDCPFMNVSGTPWTSLELIINPPQTPLSCEVLSFFGSCQASAEGFAVIFSGGSIPSGVCETGDGEDEDGGVGHNLGPHHPHHSTSAGGDDGDGDRECTGQEFVLTFEGFLPTTGVTGEANVPEPGTLALLGSGIAGLIVRRKRAS